jgi:hypothetical protein
VAFLPVALLRLGSVRDNGASFGFLLAVAVGLSGWWLSDALLQSRQPSRTVTVKGLSERDVEADLALWTLSFVATGDELEAVEAQVQEDEVTIRRFLTAGRIEEAAVSVQRLDVQDRVAASYYSGPTRPRYVVRKTLLVRSSDVVAVEERSQRVNQLVRAGVVLSSDRGADQLLPTYLFTQLTAIKPEMVAEATRNARTTAEQFAQDADTQLGGILEARQGLFQILARDKAPQLREPQQRRKTVRVVSTLKFSLQ